MNHSFRRRRVPTEPGRAELVPRIKSTQMLVGLAGMGYSPDQFPVTEHLVADLVISYAFDLPEMFQMVMPDDLERLAIKSAELRDIAIFNLKRQLPEIGMMEVPPVMRVVTGNSLEACVLLADSWWAALAADTPGEIVASVPTRDVLLYCSSHSAEGMHALREYTDEVHDSETTHALSKCLLVWRDGRWIVF
jgi:uncharacterized protein YtpQ (UPF0354 family)